MEVPLHSQKSPTFHTQLFERYDAFPGTRALGRICALQKQM